MGRAWLGVWLLAWLSCTRHGAAAQDASAPEEGAKLYGVELEPKDDFPDGKAQYLEARADATGQQYKVAGTELDQPILVSVLTGDPADVVRVRLTRISSDGPDSDQTTTGATRLDSGFRPFHGLRRWVPAGTPKP